MCVCVCVYIYIYIYELIYIYIYIYMCVYIYIYIYIYNTYTRINNSSVPNTLPQHFMDTYTHPRNTHGFRGLGFRLH